MKKCDQRVFIFTESGVFTEESSFSRTSFLINECEVKPNKAAARSMLYVMVVIVANWIATEVGVYRIDLSLMRQGSFIALLLMMIPVLITHNGNALQKRSTKYYLILCAIAATFVINAMMSFHVALSLILPLLLAMQYRSKKLGYVAFAGSLVCGFFAPIVSFSIGAWDTLFLQVLLEMCGIGTVKLAASASSFRSLGQIVLYISLPQMLIILITSLVMFTVIDNGKKTLDNQIEIRRGNDRVMRLQEGILGSMALMIESRDGGTGEHVANTRKYVSLILEYMLDHGIRPETVTHEYASLVVSASILHDIGKITIPDAILNKPGRFTPEEYEIMKTHTTSGRDMIDKAFGSAIDEELIPILRAVVGSHHEWWNGKGYPNGLAGEDIPLEGRVMAIADVFDALISKRVYKDSYSVEEAYRILESESGTHFDAELVEIFKQQRPAVEAYVLSQK